jgi:O-antigen/teichoic acid export membrane protein
VRAEARPRRGDEGLHLYYLGFAIGRLAPLLVLPFLSRTLGVAGFGEFEASYALLAAATIVLDAGFGTGLARFVGGGLFSTRELVGSAGRLQLLASLAATAVIAVPLLLLGPEESSPVLVVAASLAFCILEGYAAVAVGLLRAEGRNGVFLLLSIGRLVTTCAAGVAGAHWRDVGGALLGVAVGGAPFASYAVARAARARPTSAAQRALIQYGVPLMATTVMSWTLNLSDRVILRAFGSGRDVALYAANYRLGSVVLVFVAGPLALAWVPVARRICDAEELRRACARWFRAVSVVALGLTSALALLAGVAVPRAFGGGFAADAYVVAAAGVAGWLSATYVLLTTPIIVGTRTARLSVIAAGAAAFSVATNVALIPTFGGRGAATATVVSYAGLCAITAWFVGTRDAGTWLYDRAQIALVVALLAVVAASAILSRFVEGSSALASLTASSLPA